jgi:hypothetical protein
MRVFVAGASGAIGQLGGVAEGSRKYREKRYGPMGQQSCLECDEARRQIGDALADVGGEPCDGQGASARGFFDLTE